MHDWEVDAQIAAYENAQIEDYKQKNERRNLKMNQMNPQATRIVTEEVRFSYVNLIQPRESQYGGEPKFSVTILLPKSDMATKARIDAAIEAAKQNGKAKSWGGVIPPMVATPIHDGDGVRPSDGMPFGEECKGHWVFSASTGLKYPPKIVDLNGNAVIDPTEVYSGMYGRIALNFAPYNQAGKKGIGCYIATNVQKTRDGEPLGSSDPAATDDFGITGQVNSAPMFNQPQAPNYSQPQQPSYGNWEPGGGQVNYGQPAPHPAAGGVPPVDPITGQPYSGGYGQ